MTGQRRSTTLEEALIWIIEHPVLAIPLALPVGLITGFIIGKLM